MIARLPQHEQGNKYIVCYVKTTPGVIQVPFFYLKLWFDIIFNNTAEGKDINV
ncbi:MAG: hypothetical protein AB7G87_14490 [Clostridia bacterium]